MIDFVELFKLVDRDEYNRDLTFLLRNISLIPKFISNKSMNKHI